MPAPDAGRPHARRHPAERRWTGFRLRLLRPRAGGPPSSPRHACPHTGCPACRLRARRRGTASGG